VKLRADAPQQSINNFGKDDEYILAVYSNDLHRLFPAEEYGKSDARIHLLGSLMPYRLLRERFQII
jgi:hypothetical protein